MRRLLVALFLMAALPAHADDLPPMEGVLPIERAIATVAGRYQGRMIAAEIAEKDDAPVYDFRWLTPQDNVLRIRLDAVTGRFLLVEGVGQTDARILP